MQSFSFHDLILGGQDGLVNVLGIILGLVAAGASAHIIIVAGLAAGFSEAVSMGGVAYTSALPTNKQEERSHRNLWGRGIAVGIYALIGSIVPLISFFFLPTKPAVIIAIAVSIVVLFLLGFYRVKHTHENKFKSGLQMLLIGMLCALAGFVVGLVLK